MKCKRVLHVVSAMHRGGAETMIMNVYREIDRDKIQFDFISHSDSVSDYDLEIEALGGRIFRIPSMGKVGIRRYIKNLTSIIKKKGPFIAIHSHTNLQGGIVALAGKLSGVKMRIAHSHNTSWISANRKFNNIQINILKCLIEVFATDYFACGSDAAKYLFLNNRIRKNRYKIIKNVISINRFVEGNYEEVNELRSELGIGNGDIIVGHIGRFHPQKNHSFIIKLANKLKKEENIKFILLGDGELIDSVKSKIEKYNLEKKVMLLGIQDNVVKFMNLFDIFILPSLYEGLPLVLIEAQACGIYSLVSNNITKEVDLGLGLINYTNLKYIDEWEKEIVLHKNRIKISSETIKEKFKETGYDAIRGAKELLEYYLNE